jgi:hypothetical protein
MLVVCTRFWAYMLARGVVGWIYAWRSLFGRRQQPSQVSNRPSLFDMALDCFYDQACTSESLV